ELCVRRPATKFAGGLLGTPAMNFIDVTVRSEAGTVSVESEGLRLTVGPADASALATHNGRRGILRVRAEHLVLGDGAPGLGFDARVEVVEQLGSEILLETRVGGASVTAALVPAETALSHGAEVRL